MTNLKLPTLPHCYKALKNSDVKAHALNPAVKMTNRQTNRHVDVDKRNVMECLIYFDTELLYYI